ncbi:hypothetical protein PGT21_030603 [Puccinia graminis f. sp. tritici]|uniref:Methyltransferase type 11 domain-containing protein n=1 Tax=Puccinia graminis f. sp. tritici TaxID=56615 RepID=A0A5B0QPA1_PUCGR|nr:hypothetical protein PGT21_030603 [Puccinia graminis f. sp. tritici]
MSTSFSNPDYSAKSYLDHRPRYPQQLYQTILDFHNTPSTTADIADYPTPQTKLALDLGCGPGIATSELVPHFEKVVAVDESEPMIQIASGHLPHVDCRVGSATRIPIESGTVDLITVATAAHWFPDQWWEEASRVLKPGGTVAVWTVSHQMMIEPSHPKTRELNELQVRLVEAFRSYLTAGNQYVIDMYDTLPLPSPELRFGPPQRIVWNREKVDDLKMFMGSKFNIDTLRKRLHTYSPIYRWRTDNPTKKDTEDDPVEQMFSNLKKISGWDDSTEFTAGHPLALIMIKKLG